MRISVVLCTRNGASYLQRQLRSLLDQRRLPDEVIVRDDASCDQTANLIKAFAAVAPFNVRVTFNSQPLGTNGNFQAGFGDQDDVWYPEKLSVFEAAMSAGAETDLGFGDADLVDQQLRPLGQTLWESIGFTPRRRMLVARGQLWQILTKFNVVSGAGMAFSARRRDLLLPIPEGWMYDGWMALMLSAAGKCRAIAQPLAAYRQHPDQQIGAGPSDLAGRISIARRMDGDYFLRLADNFGAAVDRLRQHGITGAAVDRFAQKADHCRLRAENRLFGICSEIFTGRYFSCSLGWQSVAQDLVLRRHGVVPA